MISKYTMMDLIRECHAFGYIQLRNDLIEDVKERLNDEELAEVLEMVEHGTVQSLQEWAKHRNISL